MKAKSLRDLFNACSDITEIVVLIGDIETKISSVNYEVHDDKIIVIPKQ